MKAFGLDNLFWTKNSDENHQQTNSARKTKDPYLKQKYATFFGQFAFLQCPEFIAKIIMIKCYL